MASGCSAISAATRPDSDPGWKCLGERCPAISIHSTKPSPSALVSRHTNGTGVCAQRYGPGHARKRAIPSRTLRPLENGPADITDQDDKSRVTGDCRARFCGTPPGHPTLNAFLVPEQADTGTGTIEGDITDP